MPAPLQISIEEFEREVTEHFAFLESEWRMEFHGARMLNEDDPRDRAVSVRYRSDELRIDISWNELAQSITLLLRLQRNDLPRRERYLYLDPFVEFLSGGKVRGIVPQYYPGMSETKIERIFDQRRQLLENNGLGTVLHALANELRRHGNEIKSVSTEVIQKFHRWYNSQAGQQSK